MLLFGVCFVLYFIKLFAGKGLFFIHPVYCIFRVPPIEYCSITFDRNSRLSSLIIFSKY